MEERADLRADLEGLRRALQEMEWRLRRVELSLRLPPLNEASRSQAADSTGEGDGSSGIRAAHAGALEFQIGEFWLGQVGLVALLLGIAFFISTSFGAAFPPALQIFVGFLAAGGLFALSRHWGGAYPFTSRIFFAGSLILLYFSTLRLHFFTAVPLIPDKAVGLALLTLVLGFLLYVAVARRAEHLVVIALLLGFATSLCSDTGHFALALTAVTAAAAVYLQLRYAWVRGAVLLSVFLAYATHLIWVFNNPILGHPIQAVSEPHGNLIYLFICAALFGVANLPRRQGPDSAPASVALAFFNGAGFYGLGSVVALTYFRGQFAGVNLLIAAFFLALAAAHWAHRQSRYSTALYACFGYVALSVAIVVRFESPDRFIYLGWQSLLVISTAIWFRSKIVVVTNLFIYLGVLLTYLFLGPPDLRVDLSYAAVALLSARVMNWQRQRLTLKTELMRNVYLASAFVVVPYGLYHGVPQNYVSLFWLGAALFYFAMSLLLKNRKYRWMAIWTMLLTVIYVFVIDLAQLSSVYRTVSFLALGLTLLAVSWVYARRRRQKDEG